MQTLIDRLSDIVDKNTLVTADDISEKYSADWSGCLLYTSPSPRDRTRSRMPSSA